jgi:hypothetical protein
LDGDAPKTRVSVAVDLADTAELAWLCDAVAHHAVDDLEARLARRARRAGAAVTVEDEKRHHPSLYGRLNP